MVPAESDQVGDLLKFRHATHAQPADRSHPFWQPEQLLEEGFLVERHPPDPEVQGGGHQPQVLYGTHHRERPGVADGVAPQDVGAEACRIVGGDDSQPGFADPLDLDGIELLPLVLVEGVGIVLPALRDVFGEGVEDGGVADHDEIPRLTVAHARGGVRRVQQVGEFLLAQGVAGELGTHVTAALDDRFEGFLAVQIHAEDPSGNFLAASGGQQVIPAAALTRQPGRRRCFNASHLPSMISLKRSSTYQRRALRMGRGDHGPPRRSGKTRETHRAASRCG